MPPAQKKAATKKAASRRKASPPAARDTSPPAYDVELAAKVLELKRAGGRFDRIAVQLGISVEATVDLFEAALAATDTKFRPALHAERLEALFLAAYPKAARGDLQAIDRVVLLGQQIERLLGEGTDVKGRLLAAYEETIEASTKITSVDAALVEAGRTIARRVDSAIDRGEGQEVTKALYLLPHLMNVLREAQATPTARLTAAAGKGEGAGNGSNGGTQSTLGRLQGIAGGRSA